MSWQGLIPTPDAIPAPWGVFETLETFTFIIHMVFVNVVLGGILLLLYNRLFKPSETASNPFQNTLTTKIPTMFALSVTFGVAPLLFMQVLYGHFFYSSSVIMAVAWILVIPSLIIAYYGIYIYKQSRDKKSSLATISLAIAAGLVLYIAFIEVNNMTLMVQPQKWTMYFSDRSGGNLNLGEVTLIPRYLHFIVASIAVAGLFSSVVWYFRKSKEPLKAQQHIYTGLRVFSVGTAIQMVIGLWFLIALPGHLRALFIGGNSLYSFVFGISVLLGVGAMITGFLRKLWPTVWLLLGTVATMVLTRAFLRAAYLNKFFSVNNLHVNPQYSVMALFFIVFIIGLIVVGYMINLAVTADRRRVAQ